MGCQSLERKLEILTGAARYDAACASGGGPAGRGGICRSWSADGRCISLFKLLLTNNCIYDCAYCVNRRSNDTPRTAFTPRQIADLTIEFYRRNYIEGLFLSTGVVRSPDYTMELLVATARMLRKVHGFKGYLHLKLVPGADALLVRQAGRLADRISVNIELPTERSLALIAPDKSRNAILLPMRQAAAGILEARMARKTSGKAPAFSPAGQSTQLIVGASPEKDLEILTLAESLYRKMDLKRVYYSAFVPVGKDARLPALPAPPLLREHRLYQADWLLRFYGFSTAELLDGTRPDLDPDLDPKAAWALRHPEFFPVEVNRADYETLLRVPGIGVRSARRIVRARRMARLSCDDLEKFGLVWKRARYFVTANGRHGGEGAPGGKGFVQQLYRGFPFTMEQPRQLELFSLAAENVVPATVTGEF
jgi:putative DNA modification/repair radical SAM protein